MAETDIETVKDWPVPSCSKDMERLRGLANYHRFFIKNFARIAVPLNRVTGKQGFAWEDDQQLAFKELKTAVLNPWALVLPDNSKDFVLDVDASEVALVGELIQSMMDRKRLWLTVVLHSLQNRGVLHNKETASGNRAVYEAVPSLLIGETIRYSNRPQQFDLAAEF